MHKQRIQYIDSLRGFAILLVVIHHVYLYSFNTHPVFSINTIFLTFRMPLFFFLSGYLFYKPERFSEKGAYNSFLKQKIKIQIIPTIIFGTLFALMMDISALNMLFHQTKHGYWFTFVLFVYFFFFSTTSFFCRKHSSCSEHRLLLIIALSAFIISTPSCLSDLNNYHFKNKYFDWCSSLLSFNKWWYYIYFVFGALIKKYNFQINNIRGTKMIMFLLILDVLLQIIRYYYGPISLYCLYGIVDLILGFLGIIIIVLLFSGNEKAISKDNAVGRFLQYIGVRTLDIYLLHYFFIPRNLQQIGAWFTNNCNPILELTTEFIISIVIILFCLVASNIIRCSDRLAVLLFGKIL